MIAICVTRPSLTILGNCTTVIHSVSLYSYGVTDKSSIAETADFIFALKGTQF